MSDSNKSTGRLAGWTYSSTATHISSSNCSVSKTSVLYECDKSMEIKEEIIVDQERHQGAEQNLLSEKNRLDEKSISSVSDSAIKTENVYKYEETLEIKEEVIQDQERHQGGEQNLLSEKNQLDEKSILSINESAVKTENVYKYDEALEMNEEVIQDPEIHEGGEQNLLSEKSDLDEHSYCSRYKSAFKTENVYDYDETLEIKEEVIQDQERHEGREQNLLSEKSDLDEHSYSSRYKSAFKTENVYEYDETLDFREEIIQDQETVDTIEADFFGDNKLRIHKKTKIQDPTRETEEKYESQEFARSHNHKNSLDIDNKFKGGVTPQLICKFRDKQFEQKSTLYTHIDRVHRETNLNKEKQKIQESGKKCYTSIYRQQKTNSSTAQARYNCHKCFAWYSSLRALRQHDNLKHAVVKPQFICDICGHTTNIKCSLKKHMSSRHLGNPKTSQARHNCDKCSRDYSTLGNLKQHDRLQHAAVKPEFICDFCGYKTNIKSHLSKHIPSLHLKIANTSAARHNCDKCSQSYSSLGGLRYHKLVKHAAVNPKFICDLCGYKAYLKCRLSRHIFSCHVKKQLQARHDYFNVLGGFSRNG